MKEKKKSTRDIVAYSDTKKGSLILGIFFVCVGMILSIFPIQEKSKNWQIANTLN